MTDHTSDVPGGDIAAEQRPRFWRRPRLLIALGAVIVLVAAATGITAATLADAEARYQEQVATELTAAQDAYASTASQVSDLSSYAHATLAVLEASDLSTEALEAALAALDRLLDSPTPDSAIEAQALEESLRLARGLVIEQLGAVTRSVVALGNAAAEDSSEAGEALATLREALLALSTAPRGSVLHYANHARLVDDVLVAAATSVAAHAAAIAARDEAGANEASGSTGGTGGGGSGGGTGGGGSGGGTGGGTGGGGTAPPPPPPPHPRADYCANTGYAGNSACLNEVPASFTTNGHFVAYGSCNRTTYNTHQVGWGGTSTGGANNFSFPWSASVSGPTVTYYVCL